MGNDFINNLNLRCGQTEDEQITKFKFIERQINRIYVYAATIFMAINIGLNSFNTPCFELSGSLKGKITNQGQT